MIPNLQLQGSRGVISNHPELTAKLLSERPKILEFLLSGVREFQKQGSGSDEHIAISQTLHA
ncbi:MAG: hypothetical protein VR65_24885 [Desulfobulbaceae bacterium BRH_c16a]|nr:MAG: hypothetical protein VR65_24885 [Desulfobulbaceae bacterium BRH_c16a]